MSKLFASLLTFVFVLAITSTSQAGTGVQPIQVRTVASSHDQAITLGAGDNLGRACFTHYVAVVRAEQQQEIRQAQGPAPVAKPHTPLIAQAAGSVSATLGATS